MMDFSMDMKKKRLKECPSPKQCVTLESEDRLSNLPEELRRRIVSRLPLQDAVRSTILSTKWRRVCYSLPNLVLDYLHFPDVERKLERFVEFIDHMISQHDGSNIETFSLDFWDENESYACTKNEWITFSVQRNVEIFFLAAVLGDEHKLPSCVFTSKSLKKLHLAIFAHVLKLPTPVDLPNLKELFLGTVCLDDDSTRNLFSSCPALETLQLRCCYLSRVTIFDVYAPNLKHFHINKCFGLDKCRINLQTPSLKTFVYKADIPQEIKIVNISSVCTGSLCFRIPLPGSRSSFSAVTLLRGLFNLLMVTQTKWFTELHFSQSGHPFRHLKIASLNRVWGAGLDVWPVKEHVQKTIAVLTTMVNLKRLCIFISGLELPPNLSYVEMDSQELSHAESLNQLEFVDIENFEGHESELELVEFLLRNAKTLVEMKIEARKRSDHTIHAVETNEEKRIAINHKLLAFWRASSRAKISFA